MGRGWLCVMMLASSRAIAGTRYEIDLGIAAEHIAGGWCSDGIGGGMCGDVTAGGLAVGAGQLLQPDHVVSVIVRELISETKRGSFGVLRSYLGVGARLEPFGRGGYVELTVGGDLQFGSVPSGEAGFVGGVNLASALRIGAQYGRWEFTIEGFVVPTALNTLGFADYGGGALASRAFGD